MEPIKDRNMSTLKKIRTIIDPVLKIIFQGIHCIYSYSFHQKLLLLPHYLYTLWVSSNFGEKGKALTIYHPLRLRGGKYISIGAFTTIGRHAVITAWNQYGFQHFKPKIYIGDHCDFGEYLHLSCIEEIRIGNNVLTGRWVTIVDNAHGDTTWKDLQKPPALREIVSKGAIIIEDNVWIADKVTILPGVKIGKGAVIGANSVVTHNIPPYTVVAGSPARIKNK